MYASANPILPAAPSRWKKASRWMRITGAPGAPSAIRPRSGPSTVAGTRATARANRRRATAARTPARGAAGARWPGWLTGTAAALTAGGAPRPQAQAVQADERAHLRGHERAAGHERPQGTAGERQPAAGQRRLERHAARLLEAHLDGQPVGRRRHPDAVAAVQREER